MAQGPVRPVSSGSDSSIRVSFRLVHRGREIPLESGEYTIGRAQGSDVFVDDPLVSRRHARLLVNDTTALLEDLQSENGVYVNEQRIRRSVRLADGDRILIGTQEFSFVVGDARAHSSGTIDVAAPSSGSWRSVKSTSAGATSTLEADAFEYLGQIADRMIRAKRGQTAERLLRGHLEEVMNAARESGVVDRDVLDAACTNALRLAVGLGRASWVDFVIELLFTCRVPPSPATAIALRSVLGTVSGIDLERWSAYEQLLVSITPTLTASDRTLARSFLWLAKG